MQWCVHTQLCLTLCNSMDCNPPGSSVHGILQVRTLEWVAMPSSRGSSQLRDRTQVSHISGGLFTSEPPGKTSNVISSPKEEFIHPVAENCFELCLLCPGAPPPHVRWQEARLGPPMSPRAECGWRPPGTRLDLLTQPTRAVPTEAPEMWRHGHTMVASAGLHEGELLHSFPLSPLGILDLRN